jgi:hypothetical protein
MCWLYDRSLACTLALPPDGCPMFADFRVHGLNKMGDPKPLLFLSL